MQHLIISNAKNEEKVRHRLEEIETKKDEQLQFGRHSLKEKLERMSRASAQIAKLSADQIKRIRYASLKLVPTLLLYTESNADTLYIYIRNSVFSLENT